MPDTFVLYNFPFDVARLRRSALILLGSQDTGTTTRSTCSYYAT